MQRNFFDNKTATQNPKGTEKSASPALQPSAPVQPETRTHYEVFGVPRDCNQKGIKTRYNQLALKYHPDKNHAPLAADEFKRVAEAYAVLSDPKLRALYDAGKLEGYSKQSTAYADAEESDDSKDDEEFSQFYADFMVELKKDWGNGEAARKEIESCVQDMFESIPLLRKLFGLIKDKKLTLEDLKTGDPLIMEIIMADNLAKWCLRKDGPDPLKLIEEFKSKEQEDKAASEEKKQLQGEKPKTLTFKFRIFITKKYFKDQDIFSCDEKDFLDRLKQRAILLAVETKRSDYLYRATRLRNGFKKDAVMRGYLENVEKYLFKPMQKKIQDLKDEKTNDGLEKATELEKIQSEILKEYVGNLRSTSEYVEHPCLERFKPQKIHRYIVMFVEDTARFHNTIDHHRDWKKDIFRGLLGVLLALSSGGLLLASSRFKQLFFYTDTRARFDRGMGNLNKHVNSIKPE